MDRDVAGSRPAVAPASSPSSSSASAAARAGTGPSAAAPSGVPASEPADREPSIDVVLADLVRATEQLVSLSFDALADGALEQLLDGLRVPASRLEAVRARGFADLERRASARAPAGGRTAAELEQRRRNARLQRMAPSQAKRTAEAGRAAADHAAAGAAFRSGDLDVEHVRLIGTLLRRVPLGQREELEEQFIALARELDPVAFGRRARELLARHQPEAAERIEQLAEDRRSVRATDTADGGFAFSGLLYGTAAETARVALSAFRRPDTPDEHRTPEQRTADAFEQLCASALRAGEAPTNHGVRPHVLVVIDEADLDRAGGVARLAHSGQPVPASAIGHLLDDAAVSRLVRDVAGTPLEASIGVRTVPSGLWRALVARDGGCTWRGCDAPPAWCDVAHGEQAFRDDGQLSPSNAALLCRRHHRRFDRGPFRMTIHGDQVRYQRDGAAGAVALTTERPPPPVRTYAEDREPARRRPDRSSERATSSDNVGRRRRTRRAVVADQTEAITLFDGNPASGGGGPP